MCIDDICTTPIDGGPTDTSTDGSINRDDAPLDAPSFAIRINIAGQAHDGLDYPGSWSADPGTGGICNGMPFSAPTTGINGTNDPELFVEQMFSPTLACTIPNIPAGSYHVTLLLAELRLGGAPCTGPAGSTRVFDIALEGTTVATGFDMTAACGGCAAAGGPGHAIDRSFDVDILDGTLNLAGTASSGAAAVNAIEIVAR